MSSYIKVLSTFSKDGKTSFIMLLNVTQTVNCVSMPLHTKNNQIEFFMNLRSSAKKYFKLICTSLCLEYLKRKKCFPK